MAEDFLTELLAQSALELIKLRLVKTFKVASPAAGADWLFTVPGGVMWELLSVTTVLTTSAVVANRNPRLRVTDSDSTVLGDYPIPAAIAASTGSRLTWAAGYGNATAAGSEATALPSPPILLWNMQTVGTSTGAIDVADQYSSTAVVVREWDVTSILQEVEELDEQFEAYIARRA